MNSFVRNNAIDYTEHDYTFTWPMVHCPYTRRHWDWTSDSLMSDHMISLGSERHIPLDVRWRWNAAEHKAASCHV
jgi:hypothetical protein